jgi:hypothetical protein
LAIRLRTDNKARKGLETQRRMSRIKLRSILCNQTRMEIAEEVKEDEKVKANEGTESNGEA